MQFRKEKVPYKVQRPYLARTVGNVLAVPSMIPGIVSTYANAGHDGYPTRLARRLGYTGSLKVQCKEPWTSIP